MTPPPISIGLPVYNGGAHLAAAIESVLAQSFTDFELIISDNASTDQTEAVCSRFVARDSRIRYLRNPENIGAVPNFNRVFELSNSPYFKWAAHDDLIEPTYVQQCYEILKDAPPSVALIFARRRFITYDGVAEVPGPGSYFHGLDHPDRRFHRPSFARLVRMHLGYAPMFLYGLARASALKRTRLLQGIWAPDALLAAEIRLQGELWEVPEPLYIQRLHAPTPQWLLRTTKRGEAIWMDPRNASKQMNPELRLFTEHLGAIHHARLNPFTKAFRYLAMSGYLWNAGNRLLSSRPLMQRLRAKLSATGSPGGATTPAAAP